jgi:type I restriction enzyme S subunit
LKNTNASARVRSKVDNDGEITQMDIIVDARYEYKNGKYYIIYEETGFSEMRGCTTTIKIEPDCKVWVRRSGALTTSMCYEEGKAHSCVYSFDFGSIKRLEKYDQGALSTLYICFSLERFDSDFIKHYFDSLKWYREIYMISAEGARNHGLLNVPTEDFFATLHTLPMDTAEQRRIAEFLDLLTSKIEKQQALVDNLKKYKRGVLKAILEQRLRFKRSNGENYPKWESYTISEITDCLDRRRVPITSNERIKGAYPYYGANGIQDYVADYIFDGEFVLLAEDGGHFNDFATEPIAQYVSGKIWVNNHAHILQAKCNTHFLFYALVHKDIRNYINNPSRGKLNQEDMQGIVIDVPCKEEQERIVNFLLKIDQNIEAKLNTLNQLVDFKKGLLQQLFI